MRSMQTTVRHTLIVGIALAVVGLSSGCDELRQLEFGLPAKGNQTMTELNPPYDMVDMPSLKAQERGMLKPAPLTVSTTTRGYPAAFVKTPDKADFLQNPVPMTKENLKQGKALYNSYCLPCHGPRGLSNGPITTKFPKPPALTSRTMQKRSDGRIFHIVSNGQNIMPHYRTQIRPMERWAIVNYVRALQRAEYPREKDVARFNALPKDDPLRGAPPKPKVGEAAATAAVAPGTPAPTGAAAPAAAPANAGGN